MGRVFFRSNCLSESSVRDRISLEKDYGNSQDMDLATYHRLGGTMTNIQYYIDHLRKNPELLNKLTAFDRDELITELEVIESLLRKTLKR